MDRCIERVVPPLKEPLVKLRIPSIETISGVAEALNTILQAAAAGKLTPADAVKLTDILQERCRIIATIEHENRLQTLESLGPNSDGKLKEEEDK
jgi:hypothetical protein